MGFLYILVTGVGAVVTFIPFLEKLMLDYVGILSAVMFTANVLFVNYCQSLGLVSMSSYYPAMLAYVSRTRHSCPATPCIMRHAHGHCRVHELI